MASCDVLPKFAHPSVHVSRDSRRRFSAQLVKPSIGVFAQNHMTLALQDRGKFPLADRGAYPANGRAGVCCGFSDAQTTRLNFWFWSFYRWNSRGLLSEMRHSELNLSRLEH